MTTELRQQFQTTEHKRIFRDALAQIVGCAWYMSHRLLFATDEQCFLAQVKALEKIASDEREKTRKHQ